MPRPSWLLVAALCVWWQCGGVAAQGPTGAPGKPWASGQLGPGESRKPRSSTSAGVMTGPRRSIPEKGRVHIGTGEYYRDSNGVRSIDKVMSGYIQGVCVDFTSETKESCERRNGKEPTPWFACPENFPHADSKIKNNRAGIPLCFTDRRFARAGSGPPGSWCVPRQLVGMGPEIAKDIQAGNGMVCVNRYRRLVRKDRSAERRWRQRATDTGKELEKVTEKYLSYQERNAENRRRKRRLRREVRDERAKEQKWKALAKGYKQQVEDDRASAQVRFQQLLCFSLSDSCLGVCLHLCVCVCVCARARVRVRVRVCVRSCVYVCMQACMDILDGWMRVVCVCMHACTCAYSDEWADGW